MPPYAQLLMTALGLGGNLMGMNKSANSNNQYDQYLKNMSSRNDAEYNKDYNTNYLDTEEAKAAIRAMYDQMNEINDDADSSSAITGASAEKGVAMKEKLNKNFTQGISQLSGQGTRRKDMIKGQYNSRMDNLDMMKLQNMMQKSQNGSQFAQNASQLGVSGLLMGSQGGFD